MPTQEEIIKEVNTLLTSGKPTIMKDWLEDFDEIPEDLLKFIREHRILWNQQTNFGKFKPGVVMDQPEESNHIRLIMATQEVIDQIYDL
jgi:hypothetical protein